MKITTGSFRYCVVYGLLEVISYLKNEETRKTIDDDTFVQLQPTPLSKGCNLEKLYNLSGLKLKELLARFPHLEEVVEQVQSVLFQLKNSSLKAQELLKAYQIILEVCEQAGLDIFSSTNSGCFVITAEDPYIFIHSINERLLLKNGSKLRGFIQEVCRLNEILRVENRRPTRDEFIATQVAYKLIQDGEPISYPYCHWGTFGYREIQTYMSITDPGEGHINGTASCSDYLKGVIVHIEYLERGNQDRQKVESYRIPNVNNVAKARLHIGSDAPLSSYIGRPIFENGFELGLLKSVNTIASACSEMLGIGLAECKIAIEGMTATQAIEFMQCIAGAVRRDKYTQFLSAAFNINTPVLDDRSQPHRWVTDRFEIGLLGIELTKAGGFDKVTWDGSSDSYPSNCILEQLTDEQALELVHQAHEVGLLTYFSAGFRFHHLSLAVYTGVDGVGVGGAQILRYMDKTTGYHGSFKPENIAEILRIRDEAASHWLGQSAFLLSRLDRMFYEGSLTAEDNQLRLELLTAMKTQAQEMCCRLLDRLNHIRQMPPDTENPLIEWGKRLIATGEKSLLAQMKTPQEQTTFVQSIGKAIETHDIDLLSDELERTQSTFPPAHSAVICSDLQIAKIQHINETLFAPHECK